MLPDNAIFLCGFMDFHAVYQRCHDSVLSTLKSTTKNRTGGKIEEEKEKKENGKEGTQIYSGIQGTDGGAIQIRHAGQGAGAAVWDCYGTRKIKRALGGRRKEAAVD